MKNSILILFFLFSLSACVKETVSECPPQYSVRVQVQDKNYANATNPLSADLAFREYVSSLCYALYNAETNELVRNVPTYNITSYEKTQQLDFSDLPQGSYRLTAWGNMPAGAEAPLQGATYTLHEQGAELGDVYVASHDFTVTAQPQASTMSMERTKGNLQIICSNFPDSVARVEIDVTNVYGAVDAALNHTAEASVTKSFTLSSAADVLQTYVAPTIEGRTSQLSITLFTQNDAVLFSANVDDVNIRIERNKISDPPILVNYDELQGAFTIWQMVNGEWQQVTDLDIVDIKGI
jgi:hypothetical protein